ncbi:MAG TPA: HAMP domain-containing sensor histidine kinase [Bacillota bacterium]|nr:HAMP domain-containing sensor histidine kinase [Bacillota bacterium]
MKGISKMRMAINLILLILVFSGCQMAGYALSSLLFFAAGSPAAWMVHLISAVVGFGIFAGVAALVSFYITHSSRWKEHNRRQGGFLTEAVDVLNRIARGDFNVSVPTYDRDPFPELAESINKMARELGSMETMRQDFISNVSHEIQSPLTSISGFAALLKSGALTPEQRIHYIEVIESESRRLSKLSENLLKLSALEADGTSINRREYRLDKQIEHITLMMEPHWMEKDINVEAELQKAVYSGDEELLSQVWINLLHNSIKFTPEKGSITITLSVDEKEAVCGISDTGIGISQEDQAHIFERFYKADKSRDRSLGGSGLGLSLVKKIVELHGGTVSVESKPKEGSVFTVRLPVDS